jgi:hypothetical protein
MTPLGEAHRSAAANVLSPAALDWLMAGDPAIRWQVLRDLADAPAAEVEAERVRVAAEGWGARLLAEQDADGRWAGALYSPKWVSTTYTLLLLYWLGLPPGNERALAGCRQLWDGGLVFGPRGGQPETCEAGMAVLLSAGLGYLGGEPQIERAVQWLLGEQLDDGGWNCEARRTGSRHGSFHTSVSALDALTEYRKAGGQQEVDAAVVRGQEFFLAHRLYRSHRTGEPAKPAFQRYPFPPQWHFDVMRGLEHFRIWNVRDARLEEAADLVRRGRKRDGTWHRHNPYPGRYWFELEPPGPSRWATLRAARVLRWWDGP